MIFYQLLHLYDNGDDAKDIGYYSSLQKAKETIEALREKPGFRDYPNGFFIVERKSDSVRTERPFYEAMIYYHSPYYETECSTSLGYFDCEDKAAKVIKTFFDQNPNTVPGFQLETIINKCILDRVDWSEGFVSEKCGEPEGKQYDAWGKILSATTTGASAVANLAEINPLRYRGYYYDTETGFYYVSSRYYDPAIGRWINADDTAYLGTGQTLVSYNLFAYCNNNPVTGYDPDGAWDWGNFFKGSGWIATGIVAVAVGVSVLTCGVAAPAMMAVAAITVTAGVATTVNGVSEIGEAATGHNFMRDDVFQGNATAYNAYAYSTAAVAQVGTAICGGWMSKNSPRINAYKSMDSYNVKNKHLSSASGDWSKFNTTSQAKLRALGQEALKNTPMSSLIPNSADSYAAIYNFGRVIGTAGQTSARLVFSTAGKIITFFHNDLMR